jgi:hypothetical protein
MLTGIGFYMLRQHQPILLLAFVILFACVPQPKVLEQNTIAVSELQPYPDFVAVEKAIDIQENVRENPNGEVLGKSMLGEKFTLLERRANWLKVSNPDFPEGYIWGPSLGYPVVDLFALNTWYDRNTQAFFRFSQYRNFLGKESRITDYFGSRRYIFADIGLGDVTDVTLDLQGQAQTQLRSRSVDIVVEASGLVKEIHVEFQKSQENWRDVAALLGIEVRQPDVNDETMMAWLNEEGLSQIQLKRLEFGSQELVGFALIR